ncbi:MAG: LptF/LptG family permease [Fimbriimonadaceae bacterium]|nr:LptF/LptG family permease [Chthonomonadaceae bacterium]MCO5297673.1 LptF/LptG family permease [Fimbriimonadaceae bacterium]
MKHLDRYVLRELVVPFLIGTIAVVLMFQANQLIAQFKAFSLQSVPASAILQSLMFRTPSYLVMTLPVGMALASSLAMSRLARESELTAIRGAGVRLLRVILPVAAFGLVVSLANFYLVERVVPVAQREARKVEQQVALLSAGPEFQSNVTVRLRAFTAFIGTVNRAPDGSILLSNVMLVERPRVGEIVFYLADFGDYQKGNWSLPKARIWTFKGERVQHFQVRDFRIEEPITVDQLFLDPAPEEQTAAQLQKAIDEGERFGRDTRSLRVAYYVRYSVPAACLVFAIVGPVFAIWLSRSGFVGVLLSIVLVFLYYNVHVVSTEIFGKEGWLSPVVAAWLPNVLFAVLGLIGLRRLE